MSADPTIPRRSPRPNGRAKLVSYCDEEDAVKASAALNMPVNYENNETAIEELIEAFEKEIYNQKVKEAIEGGNIEELNRLLLKNKGNKEGDQ